MNHALFRASMTTARLPMAAFGLLSCFATGVFSAEPVDFVHDVVPILKRNCVHCHGGREAEGDFSLNTRAQVLGSGHVEPGNPDDSHLLELVTSTDAVTQMPPADRPRMSEQDIVVLRRWIESGMTWDPEFTFATRVYEPRLRLSASVLPKPRDGRDHPIDRVLDQYLAERNLPRPESIDDAVFMRRVSLDLIGLLPSAEKLRSFVGDHDPQKRERLIDTLLSQRIDYADHWLTFFNDLLRNDYSGTGFITGGRQQISKWLYDSLINNKPFDVMVRQLIAPPSKDSQGYIDGIKWRGEVSAGQTLPIQFAQSISQSFLGINMKCASCHDSFIDRWTLKDAYGLAAIYADDSLELHRCDKPTGELSQAAWLFPELGEIKADAPRQERLQQLAKLMTHRENGRFARTIVNRLWYQLMGRGIVHPLDAMQSEPWNEGLLDYLAEDLVKNQFNLKTTLRLIATSAAYQSVSEVREESNADAQYVYRGPRAKRMTAEQFIDAIWQLTGDAPGQFDAPVVRSLVDPVRIASDPPDKPIALAGKWIWGNLKNGIAPGQETIVMRKVITLDSVPVAGGAVITCDNQYDLYVNNRWVSGGNDWTNPQPVVLAKHLKKGENTLSVIAKNASDRPNAAGLFFEARLQFEGETTIAIQSDETWQFSPAVPKVTGNKLGKSKGKWKAVTVASTLSVWDQVVKQRFPPLLSVVATSTDEMPMVRAALMKNTALMKSLGRPMREQIVSMRPDTVTTLEAIDLANEPTLSQSFAIGADRLSKDCKGNSDRIIQTLFQSALSRQPTAEEQELMRGALGDQPDQVAVQDAIWAVCMLPEFIWIR